MNATRQILATKLYLPSATTTLVERPRLLDRLHTVLHRPLATVIAPAGFGKTTLASAWAANIAADRATSVAWLTLDSYDDDPARFWSSVIAALQTIDPALGRDVLPLLSAMMPSSPAYLLTPLLNQLSELTTASIVLLLDDYHVINTPAIHEGLTFLVDHLPPHLHLILISRSDPPLPLARLRAYGQVTELRTADLRFTPEETYDFLNDVMGLELSPDTIATLETRTEGWITGLHLAALSMQNRADRAGFAHSLSGSHHFIMDYLVEEVLQRQPAPIRTFLLQTAILDRLCVSLCNAVTGSSEAIIMLEVVERANLFLISLDDERRWYRYHPLFVEMLRTRLVYEQPAHIPELHRRASAWYAQHAAGEMAMQGEAIRHALAAGDGEQAAQMVDEMAETLWSRNELITLHAWLTSLPRGVLHEHPRLALMLAQMHLLNGSFDEVAPLLDAATAALGRSGLPADEQAALHGGLLSARVHSLRLMERYEEAIALARHALELLPASERVGRSLAAFGLAITYHMQGALPAADVSYREAVALCKVVDDRYTEIVARCMHGRLLIDCGDLLGAEAVYQQALPRATLGTQRMPVAGWTLIGLGTIAYARNDLATAESLLAEGLDLVRQGGVRNAIYLGSAVLIQLRLAQGDLEAARTAAARFVQDTQVSQVPHFMRWAEAMQALVNFHSGDLSAAARWAHLSQPRRGALMFTDKAVFVIFVRVLLATGQVEAARRGIAEQLAHIASLDHVKTQIELHLLDTLALIATGDRDAARVALESALALAAPAGFIRLFLDAGEPIQALLTQPPWDNRLIPFVERVVAAFTNGMKAEGGRTQTEPALHPLPLTRSAQPLVEPLSQRELEVLRLMAAGLSNQTIADRLIISVPTVKKHGTNIFGKLHAANRTEAVAHAHDLGLLI